MGGAVAPSGDEDERAEDDEEASFLCCVQLLYHFVYVFKFQATNIQCAKRQIWANEQTGRSGGRSGRLDERTGNLADKVASENGSGSGFRYGRLRFA